MNPIHAKQIADELGISVQSFRYFLQMGEYKEFARAAKIPGSTTYTYTLIPRQIENFLGIKLIDPDKKGKRHG